MTFANFNIHLEKGIVLQNGCNGSTIAILEAGENVITPFIYIYLPHEYSRAVEAGIAAFNDAFESALMKQVPENFAAELEGAELPKAAE